MSLKPDTNLKKATLEQLQQQKPKLKLTMEEQEKILRIGQATLYKIGTEKINTATLGNLLTLIAYKNMLTPTKIKDEIQKIEKQIETIEEIKPPKQREIMLYINLLTAIGATLAGHTLADGNLYREDENRIQFNYGNTERKYTEGVSILVKNCGASSKNHNKRSRRG